MTDDQEVTGLVTALDSTQGPDLRADSKHARLWAAEMRAEREWVWNENRTNALHGDGSTYWTRCACGWSGLRVADPEVARREYDQHECRMTGEIGKLVLHGGRHGPNWAAETKALLAARADAQAAPVAVADEAEQRFQMLELK